MKNQEISVIIASCDKYNFLWNDFQRLFTKYWQLDTTNILVSETKKINQKDIISHNCNSQSWGERLLSALEYVDTEYTFLILEDYFFHSEITDDLISWHTNFLKEVDGNKIMIADTSKHYMLNHIDDTLYKFSDTSNYLTSLQPAIWKTEWLRSVTDKNFNPWQFEINGTDRIKGRDNKVYINMQKDPIYYNVIRKTKYIPETYGTLKWDEFKVKENLIELESYINTL